MHNPELWEEDLSHSWEHVYEFYGLEDEDEYYYSDAEGEGEYDYSDPAEGETIEYDFSDAEDTSVVDEEGELAG